jgi:hypothetical protein
MMSKKKKKRSAVKRALAISVVTLHEAPPVLLVTWENGIGDVYHSEYDLPKDYTHESVMKFLKLHGFD